MQGFIPKHGHNTGRVSKQQTGMAGARHRVIKCGSTIGEQYPTGARQREIIQVISNNPNEVQTESKGLG